MAIPLINGKCQKCPGDLVQESNVLKTCQKCGANYAIFKRARTFDQIVNDWANLLDRTHEEVGLELLELMSSIGKDIQNSETVQENP